MVEGIIVAEQSDCKYAFSPELNGGVQIDDILWDFGDGNTSNQTNPMHSYNNFGNYEVTMTISDSNGCCTRKTTIVDCNEPICDYYAC